MSNENLANPAIENEDGLVIIPMGGIGEFGMNLTIYSYKGKIIVVDAGVRFCDPRKLGVSSSFPDLRDFFNQYGPPFCYILTHGHEDHIGALPFYLDQFPAPVYGTAWTIELISAKLKRTRKTYNSIQLNTVESGDRLEYGDLSFEFVHVTHSIPMSCSLLIRCQEGVVFHSGDYKLDDDPVIEAPTNWEKFQEMGSNGIDLFLGDSTNSEAQGHCLGEKSTLPALVNSMEQAKGLVVCTTFSSNLWRIKLMIDAAKIVGRKFFIAGAGIEQTLNLAEKLNIYKIDPDLRASESDLVTAPRSSLMVITSGCQGEFRSSMLRMALGEFKLISLQESDRVIFSSRVIPGNERQFIFMIDELRRRNIDVITPKDHQNLHVSGHAHSEDIAKLLSFLKPKTYIPKHGGYSQLRRNAKIANTAGISTLIDKTDLICTGDIIRLKRNSTDIKGTLRIPIKYIESEGANLISPENLRHRLKIGELGMVLVTGHFDIRKLIWLNDPKIDIVGIEVSDNDAKSLNEKSLLRIKQIFKEASSEPKALDFEKIVETTRISLRRIWYELISRKPVVMVRICTSNPETVTQGSL
jgi:ribonuclease J